MTRIEQGGNPCSVPNLIKVIHRRVSGLELPDAPVVERKHDMLLNFAMWSAVGVMALLILTIIFTPLSDVAIDELEVRLMGSTLIDEAEEALRLEGDDK